MTQGPVHVFVMAAKADERLLEEFDRHVGVLEQQQLITVTHTKRWLAGTEVLNQQAHALHTAQILVLFLSPDWLAEPSVLTQTVPQILARQQTQGIYVLPVLLRPVVYEGTPLETLTLLPDRTHALTTWRHRDAGWRLVTQMIRSAALLAQEHGLPLQALPVISLRPPLFMAADLPTDFVPRTREFTILKEHLLAVPAINATAITAALRGAGGYGKTTLAQALCYDPEIQAAFPDGILWVTLGEQGVEVVPRIAELIGLLTREYPRPVSLDGAIAHFKRALAQRCCLLVIDDVWHAEDLRPWMQGGPECRRLITTRKDHLIPPEVPRVPVDAMSSQEAVQLLQAGISGPTTASQAIKDAFGALAGRLGEWPILLRLANGVLRSHWRRGERLDQALEWVRQALENQGVLAFDARDAHARDLAVANTLAVSLRELASEEVARYEELALFPEDEYVPLNIVRRFWRTTGHMNELEADQLCERLADLSLLRVLSLEYRMLQLHDVMRTYLRHRLGPRLVAIQGNHLQGYRLSHRSDPPNDERLYDQFRRHLGPLLFLG